jgi:hypothetical protein
MCIMQAVIVNVSFCWFRGQYDRSAAGGHNSRCHGAQIERNLLVRRIDTLGKLQCKQNKRLDNGSL